MSCKTRRGTPGWTCLVAIRRVPDLSSRRWSWIVRRSGQRPTTFRKGYHAGKSVLLRTASAVAVTTISALAWLTSTGGSALSSARLAKRGFGFSVYFLLTAPSGAQSCSLRRAVHIIRTAVPRQLRRKPNSWFRRFENQKFAKYCIDICRSFLVDDGESTAKMA